MSFMCGFSGNQGDDLEDLCILQAPDKKLTRKRHSFGRSKNPYSNRGLDKFEALLADLDGKRQMMYTKKGSEDISLVRFTYSKSNDVVPIVVKVKDPRKQDKDHNNKVENIKTPLLSSPKHPVMADALVQPPAKPPVSGNKSVGIFDHLRGKFGEWWRPGYSLPVFVVLIMVFLVFFGRSFEIFCTCVGWYMVPAVNKRSEIVKRSKRAAGKKEYSRKLSDKMVVSSGQMMNTQPHRRSF
ncbi:uncharacterized protein LOC143633349 [Bidens hawaiensis]|uniref:uncharacterized protein LOC143633349 n=1 Tax=Bidens hawaiensis TaxID=980011 RepID=UPI004049FC16